MKHCKQLSIIIVMLFSFIHSGTTQLDLEWSMIHGTEKGDFPSNVFVLKHKIIVPSHTRCYDQNGDKFYATRLLVLDKNGSEINTFESTSPDFSEVIDMVELNNGDIICAGKNLIGIGQPNGNGLYNYWIFRITEDGTILWSKSYGGSDNERLANIHKINENEFILTGTAQSDDGDITDGENGEIWLVKVDGNGDMIWQKSLGNINNPILNSSILLSDGNILLGSCLWESGESHDFNLMKIDTDANVIWMNELGGETHENIYCVKEDISGDIIFNGRHTESAPSFKQTDVVVRLDANGNLKWSSEIADSLESYSKMVISHDNNIDVFSTRLSYTKPYHYILAHTFSPDGEKISIDTFGGTNVELFKAVATDYNDYYITSSSNSEDGDVPYNLGDMDVWTFKLSKTVSNTQDKVGVEEQIKLYPNPTSDKVFVEFKDEYSEAVLINVKGQVIKELKLKEDQVNEFDLGAYENGIYYIHISNGTDHIYRKILKIN